MLFDPKNINLKSDNRKIQPCSLLLSVIHLPHLSLFFIRRDTLISEPWSSPLVSVYQHPQDTPSPSVFAQVSPSPWAFFWPLLCNGILPSPDTPCFVFWTPAPSDILSSYTLHLTSVSVHSRKYAPWIQVHRLAKVLVQSGCSLSSCCCHPWSGWGWG